MLRGLLQVAVDTCGRTGRIGHLQLGPYTAHVISHPDHLRHCLVDREGNFVKGTALQHLRILLGDGLVTSDGATWKRNRKIAQPAFHREKLIGLLDLATGPIREMLAAWDRGPEVTTFELHTEMKRLVFLISGLTLFGCNLGDDADEATKAFAVALGEIARRIENVYAAPLWIPTPGNVRLARAVRTLDRHVNDIIRCRPEGEGNDVLSLFLRARRDTGDHFHDRQLRDEVITLYLAGHDATSHALAWTFHFISRHPPVHERLLDEIGRSSSDVPTAQEIQSLTYTRQVIQESLRLRPPGALIARQVVNDDEVGGTRLPAGSWVLLVPYLTHFLTDYWPDPDRFDPDRFAGDGAARRHAYSFYPFGMGPRTCIGNHLAMLEIQLVIAMVMRRYVIEPAPGTTGKPTWHATLHPKGGLRMTRRRRAC